MIRSDFSWTLRHGLGLQPTDIRDHKTMSLESRNSGNKQFFSSVVCGKQIGSRMQEMSANNLEHCYSIHLQLIIHLCDAYRWRRSASGIPMARGRLLFPSKNIEPGLWSLPGEHSSGTFSKRPTSTASTASIRRHLTIDGRRIFFVPSFPAREPDWFRDTARA